MDTEQTFQTKRSNHLGIVAGICYEVGLMETINQAVGSRERKPGAVPDTAVPGQQTDW